MNCVNCILNCVYFENIRTELDRKDERTVGRKRSHIKTGRKVFFFLRILKQLNFVFQFYPYSLSLLEDFQGLKTILMSKRSLLLREYVWMLYATMTSSVGCIVCEDFTKKLIILWRDFYLGLYVVIGFFHEKDFR